MRKNIQNAVLSLLLAGIINTLYGQKLEVDVEWGKEFSAPRRSSLNDIVGFDKTGIYALKERGVALGSSVQYTLEYYNAEHLMPSKAFELNLEEEGRSCGLEAVMQLRGHLYLFSSFPNPRNNKNILSVQEIDKATLKPESHKHPIAEIDFAGESRSNSGTFSIKVSRDSSKVLILSAVPYEKNEPEAFTLSVLTNSFQPLWEKKVVMPYDNRLFDISSIRIDNDGDAYVLGLIYKDVRKSKRGGAPNYLYSVFAYRDGGKETQDYPISLEDRFLTDMQMEVVSSNKNIICAGFYSSKGTYSIAGTYFLTVDPKTKEIKTKSFKEFDIDFITQNMTEREARKAKRKDAAGDEFELYEYDLDKLLIGRDGSAMLIGEQYFFRISTYTNYLNGMPQTYTTRHYYYNDIIVVKIDPHGQIEWAEKVAKRQHTTDDGGFYSSYTLGVVKGRICFIFNDDTRNLGYMGMGKVYNYSRGDQSIVTLVSIDEHGKQVRQPLFKASDVEVVIRPKVCEQITSRDIILFGQRKKTQQFARVSF
jgi:hypothetical protein